jgi:VWFA-related protein
MNLISTCVLALLAIPLVPGQVIEKAQTSGQVRIPERSATSLFQGQQGKQRTEIHFDAATGLVTIKLLVQDSSGYFIPNIRRENFVVYENGVPQKNATVEIEHAAVLLGLLMEHGGRYQGLNKVLSEEISRAGHQLLDELGREDKVTIWLYSDKVEQLARFSQGHERLDDVFYNLKPAEVSETNLYDALLAVLKMIQPMSGRKAILLISSGIDTFSKATLEGTLKALREADTPVYAIGVGRILRDAAALYGEAGPLSRIDWKKAESDLQEIAKASGGRFYAAPSTLDLTATYDDIMENLRVRYVITYKPSSAADLDSPRRVRIALVNPKTGEPLQILDANGKTIRANVIVEDTYTPSAASSK